MGGEGGAWSTSNLPCNSSIPTSEAETLSKVNVILPHFMSTRNPRIQAKNSQKFQSVKKSDWASISYIFVFSHKKNSQIMFANYCEFPIEYIYLQRRHTIFFVMYIVFSFLWIKYWNSINLQYLSKTNITCPTWTLYFNKKYLYWSNSSVPEHIYACFTPLI